MIQLTKNSPFARVGSYRTSTGGVFMHHPFRKWAAAAAAGLAAAGVLAAAAPQALAAGRGVAQAPKEILIGTLYAGSGSFATSSIPEFRGLQFWAKETDAHGGVYMKAFHKKIPVRIVAYNDQSSSTTAANLYNQLITVNHVNVLVSDFGSVLTSVAVPIAQEHKMLLFDQTGTGASFFKKGNPYIVLTSLPTSAVWPVSLADFLIHSRAKRVAILYDSNDFDQSQASTLRAMLAKAGVTPVYDNAVPTSTSNYSVLLHAVMAQNPDAVIELGYPNNDIAFLQSLQANGAHFRTLFTIFPGQLLQLLEQNVGKAVLSGTYTYPTPPLLAYNKVNYGLGLSAFSKDFRRVMGQPVNFLDVAGYNTGLVIQHTLEDAQNLSQLGLRRAVSGLSGKMFSLDGLFRINAQGAQVGESLPVAKLVMTKTGLRANIVARG